MNPANVSKILKNCKGFDSVISKIKIKSIGNGNCLANLAIEKEHTNRWGKLHGGLSTTIVDIISSWALFTVEKGAVPSVSVDIHMNFAKEVVEGDVIQIDAKLNRCGKSLAFLDVDITDEKTGDTVAKGSHTKFLLNK